MGEPVQGPSVRGQQNIALPPAGPGEKDLGGLACPRTKSPPPGGSRDEQGLSNRGGPQGVNGDVNHRRNTTTMSMDYPTMEVPQSSHFSTADGASGPPPSACQSPSSYMDKRNAMDRRLPPTLGGVPTGGPRRGPYNDGWQQQKGHPPPEAHSASSVSPSLPYRFDGGSSYPPPPSHSVDRGGLLPGGSHDPMQQGSMRKRMTSPHPNLHHGPPPQGHMQQLPLKKQSLDTVGVHSTDPYGRPRGELGAI